jgi:hypothetical protein
MLRRYYETMPTGRRLSRIAYATTANALPPAEENAVWTEDPNFHPNEALEKNPGLDAVFRVAIGRGCAIVITP